MIQTDFYMERKDGVKLYRTYSDRNMMIQKDSERRNGGNLQRSYRR